MKMFILFILTAVLIFSGFVYAVAKKTENEFEKQWGKDIRAFELIDAKNSFPDNAVLFVGSSSIRMWETARFFDEMKVINRGFGGSKTRDVNYFFDRIVAPYTPKTIVFYAGDNDIAVGYSPETVFEDFRIFYKLCAEKLPCVRIYYISIKPSGQRFKLWPNMKKANELIAEFAESKDNLQYVDLAACLLGKNGIPKDELFESDRLHLNEKGYEVWTKKLKKVLCK